MKKLLYSLISLIFTASFVAASVFLPAEYANMKILRCEISETIYNSDNSVVSNNNYHRIFRIDEENEYVYLQKAPVDRVFEFNKDKIEFTLTTLADEYIMSSYITINRNENTYHSDTSITYDNPSYGTRNSKADGKCTYVD